jgi:hypothetical protein
MTHRILFTIIIFSLAHIGLRAQTASRKSVQAVGDKSFASKNYYDALSKYQELLEFDPKNIEYLYKASEAARLHGAYTLAAGYLDSIWVHEKSSQYPRTGFYRGQMAQARCDYQAAIAAYKSFLSEYGDVDTFLSSLAAKEIDACEWADTQMDKSAKGVSIQNMGSGVNTNYSEFAPAVRFQKFYFSSNRFENKLNEFIPKRTLSGALELKNDSAVVELNEFNVLFPGKSLGNLSFSASGEKLVFTVCEDVNDYDKRCELYFLKIDSQGVWGSPARLPEHINMSGFTHTQPCLVMDPVTGLERMFFVSDRPGGKGGLDIWYLSISDEEIWSEPINLTSINTAQDEITPYFHGHSNTLYFSSRGYLGLGGFDIYSSTPNSRFIWSTPVNLGAPFNSCLDDLYFMKAGDNKTAYLSSNRTGSKFLDDANQACCLDLYKLNIPPCDIKLKVLVFDAATRQELNGATVYLYNLKDPDSAPIEITNLNTNLFDFPINCEKEYMIVASRPEYLPDTVRFMSGKPGEFEEIIKKLYLTPKNVSLDVLTFDRQSGLDLNGTTVSLIDLTDSTRVPVVITNLNTNLSQFKLDRCHKYKLVAEKEDYAPATMEFEIGCQEFGKLTKNLFLDRILYSFLPLALFYDNDRPNPRTMDTITKLSYSATFESYYPRKAEFMNKFGRLFPTGQGDSMRFRVNRFFEDSVRGGHERLQKFLSILEEELASGKKYEIFLKGYASPLASNHYNYHLSQRRIESVKNEFYRYKNGALKKFISSGLLKISEKPFGEEAAPSGISDDLKDPKSIYGLRASRERRVEIIEIKE